MGERPVSGINDLESDLQRDAYNYALSRGWFAEKIMRTRRNGFPDYFYLRNGQTIHIEFKKSGEPANRQQLKRHREMREHGGQVFVVDNLDDAKRVLF